MEYVDDLGGEGKDPLLKEWSKERGRSTQLLNSQRKKVRKQPP